jgi:hypothetical protein
MSCWSSKIEKSSGSAEVSGMLLMRFAKTSSAIVPSIGSLARRTTRDVDHLIVRGGGPRCRMVIHGQTSPHHRPPHGLNPSAGV